MNWGMGFITCSLPGWVSCFWGGWLLEAMFVTLNALLLGLGLTGKWLVWQVLRWGLFWYQETLGGVNAVEENTKQANIYTRIALYEIQKCWFNEFACGHVGVRGGKMDVHASCWPHAAGTSVETLVSDLCCWLFKTWTI